jgi:hypothetical protein
VRHYHDEIGFELIGRELRVYQLLLQYRAGRRGTVKLKSESLSNLIN